MGRGLVGIAIFILNSKKGWQDRINCLKVDKRNRHLDIGNQYVPTSCALSLSGGGGSRSVSELSSHRPFGEIRGFGLKL